MERMFMPSRIKRAPLMHQRSRAGERNQHGRDLKCPPHCGVPATPERTSPCDVQSWGEPSEALDQPGVDQEPVEPARFRPARTGVEEPFAALEDLLLLGE